MKPYLAFLFSLMLGATQAHADISTNGHASWLQTQAPGTFNASTSDKLVVVVSGEHNFAGNLTGKCNSVTYNGQAMIKAVEQLPVSASTGGHGQTHSSVWYLDSPGSYSGAGTIVVNCTGNSWVATAIGISGTLPGVGTVSKVSGSASLGMTVSSQGSMVVTALGMGGTGNTATPLPGVTANSPGQSVTVAGLKIGTNWAGHAVARATIGLPSPQTFSFNTTASDVTTVAAEFLAANPTPAPGVMPVVMDEVPGESVKLTWNNLPSSTGGDVWVDVWIGNHPSNLVRVVSSDPDGLNLTSYVYEAPSQGTYYGRIDSYLNGAPTGQPLAGQDFSFVVSDKGLLVEKWLGLRPLATIQLLQREGILVRSADQADRVVASSLSSLPAPSGVRMSGLLTPDVSGEYTLHVAGSQNVALWLSPDDSRFSKQRVAWHLENTLVGEWGKFPTQKSAPVMLQAGVSYYIEAQVMNGVGNGHISLGWTKPASTSVEPIPVDNLRYPSADPDDQDFNNLPDQWQIDTELQISELPGALSEYGDPDKDGITNFEEYRLNSNPLVAEELANGITRDTWSSPGLSGASLTALTANSRFYDLPSETVHSPVIDDVLRGTQYAARYRGFLVAPSTGSYRFWISGNDEVQLWLADGSIVPHGESQSRKDRFGKRLIAKNQTINTNIDWGSRYEFDRTPSQRSQSIQLVAGQVYYIEALHKQGWGNTDDHVSVAWQPPGQVRAVIPTTAFLANSPHTEDVNDDGVPDLWQTNRGLVAPTYTTVQRGQFGDPDGDGLSNLQEYQYGTNPLLADTDSDGFSDQKEIFYYGTNPLVANTLAPNLVAAPVLNQYSSYTGNWTANADGSLSAWDQRGEISYTFTLSEPGVHEIIITGAAIGEPRSVERLPIVLSLNEIKGFASGEIVSNNGGSGSISAVTPWLSAGTHTLSILHDNYRTARRLRIESISIHRLGGEDLDESGIADWIEQKNEEENQLTRIPLVSRTSPVTVEGVTTRLTTAQVNYTPNGENTPTSVDITESINGSFFTDVPLSQGGSVTVNASFLDGLIQEPSAQIEWIPTNLLEEFSDDTLHIRQGDSLRLTAYDPEGTASGTFTLAGDYSNLPTGSIASSTPLAVEFDTVGEFTLNATWTPTEGAEQVATVTIVVHNADFGPNHSVRTHSIRSWTPSLLGSLAVVEADERLIFQETTVGSGARNFAVNVHKPEVRHVIARLPSDVDGAPGAILARGTVHGFHIAYLDQTADAHIVHRYDDGTWLMAGSIIGVNLPPDVTIRLRSHLQGTLFTDGSNILWLDSDDFDANGISTIYFEWAGEGDPKLCNRLQVNFTP